MTEDLKKLVESGEWTVGVWDLQFYLYNNGTAETLTDNKGKVRTFRSETDAEDVICPDVEDLEEVWIPDIKPAIDGNLKRSNENEDYKLMLKNKKHEFRYYVRDVFSYTEILSLKNFCEEILEDKKEGGYDE